MKFCKIYKLITPSSESEVELVIQLPDQFIEQVEYIGDIYVGEFVTKWKKGSLIKELPMETDIVKNKIDYDIIYDIACTYVGYEYRIAKFFMGYGFESEDFPMDSHSDIRILLSTIEYLKSGKLPWFGRGKVIKLAETYNRIKKEMQDKIAKKRKEADAELAEVMAKKEKVFKERIDGLIKDGWVISSRKDSGDSLEK